MNSSSSRSSASPSPRRYHPFSKHKNGTPGASQCPRSFSIEVIESVLARAVPEDSKGYRLWGVYEHEASKHFIGFRWEFDHWYHGYPVRRREVPQAVLVELVRQGQITWREIGRMRD